MELALASLAALLAGCGTPHSSASALAGTQVPHNQPWEPPLPPGACIVDSYVFIGVSNKPSGGQFVNLDPLDMHARHVMSLRQCPPEVYAKVERFLAGIDAEHPDTPPDDKITRVALTQRGGGPYTLMASINGSTPIHAMLDSGASNMVIPTLLAGRLMQEGSLTEDDFRGYTTAVLADGHEVREAQVMLHSVTLGDRTVHHVLCMVGEDPDTILLGQSVLQTFPAWAIDNQHSQLLLGR
jgi:clan AA aspartic protease (TIGR02281 family)